MSNSNLTPGRIITDVNPALVITYNIVDQENKEVADAIWTKFVPQALANGQLMAKPDPLIIGKGLGDLQKALDRQKAGVSAKKVVVSL